MRLATALIALFSFSAIPLAVRADDFGPRRDIAQIRSDAQRLLAHRVRESGVDPKAVTISDVVVVKEQALLSWDSGKEHGVMGLERALDRWWDALDDQTPDPRGDCWIAVAAYPLPPSNIVAPPTPANLERFGLSGELVAASLRHNADTRIVQWAPRCKRRNTANVQSAVVYSEGAIVDPPREKMGGYDFRLTYGKSDVSYGTMFLPIYGRAPTQAEMLPNPAPPRGWGGATDVFYFDLSVNGSRPVTFAPGTKIDVWFPFVLDDSLSYRVSFVMDGQFSKSIHGTIFDNVLHFELPQFTIAPPNRLQAEVEGFW